MSTVAAWCCGTGHEPGSPLRRALEHESKRILEFPSVIFALRNLLFDVRGTPAQPNMRFTLDYDQEDWEEEPQNDALFDAYLDAKLRGLAMILAHSRRLQAFMQLKIAFWKQIIKVTESNGLYMGEPFGPDNWLWMIEEYSFPCVKIVTKEHIMTANAMEALFRFFTMAPEDGMEERFARECGSASFQPDGVKVKIKIEEWHEQLSLLGLQILETTLDRVFASPTRQFGILTLSWTVSLNRKSFVRLGRGSLDIQGSKLKMTSRLLAKCYSVYKIDDVRLPTDAFAVDTVVAGSNTALTASLKIRNTLRSLKIVDMNLSALQAVDITAVCSSLRYGSRLQKISFSGSMKAQDEVEREASWCWLGFAIFYPLSKNLTTSDQLKSTKVSFSVVEPECTTAVFRVMADPVAALLNREGITSGEAHAVASIDGSGTLSINGPEHHQHEIAVCRVKQGATFYSSAIETSKLLLTLSRECELEVLAHEKSGWLCTVLPGIGLGWVNNEEILYIKHEAIAFNTVSRDVNLSLRYDVDEHYESAFLRFLHGVASRVTSVNPLGCLGITEIKVTLLRCVNFRRIDLSHNDLGAGLLETMIEVFEDGHCRKLESLNLSRCFIEHRAFERLARCLSDPNKLPALRALNLCVYEMLAESLASIRLMLSANNVLRFIHLPGSIWYPSGTGLLVVSREDDGPEMVEQQLINDEFQGAVIQVKLPLCSKLAFLSVLRYNSSSASASLPETSDSSRHNLDSFMVSAVFQFAADNFQRRIVWIN